MGIKQEQFIEPDEIEEEYLCGICGHVVLEPMHPPCGHYFCRACFDTYLSEGNEECPTCSMFVTARALLPAKTLARVVGRLRVRCENANMGCVEVVRVDAYSDHVNECKNVGMSCCHCGQRFQPSEHAAHEAECGDLKCRAAKWGCPFEGSGEEMADHLDECWFIVGFPFFEKWESQILSMESRIPPPVNRDVEIMLLRQIYDDATHGTKDLCNKIETDREMLISAEELRHAEFDSMKNMMDEVRNATLAGIAQVSAIQDLMGISERRHEMIESLLREQDSVLDHQQRYIHTIVEALNQPIVFQDPVVFPSPKYEVYDLPLPPLPEYDPNDDKEKEKERAAHADLSGDEGDGKENREHGQNEEYMDNDFQGNREYDRPEASPAINFRVSFVPPPKPRAFKKLEKSIRRHQKVEEQHMSEMDVMLSSLRGSIEQMTKPFEVDTKLAGDKN